MHEPRRYPAQSQVRLLGSCTETNNTADLDFADQHTGSHSRTKDAVWRLEKAGRVTSVRRDLLVLPDATGRIDVGLADLIDVVAPQPYLITGGSALEYHNLTDQHFFRSRCWCHLE